MGELEAERLRLFGQRVTTSLGIPRITSFKNLSICRYFMPEEGLEPTAFGL
jgi:hypothetical protein